jgi:LuxR family transcriptional regulator, maltose regulon positive regulatory protein
MLVGFGAPVCPPRIVEDRVDAVPRWAGGSELAQTFSSHDARSRGPRFSPSKFSPPRLVSRLVPRSRLFDALDSGAGRRLTLVAGSPGSGKTTLLANWLAARSSRSSVWLTCDVADSDPVRFVAALIEAMRRGLADPALGDSARQLLDVDEEVSADLMAVLCDDLEGRPDAVLVIDDFHLAGGCERVLGDFLESRPLSLQVVVASRTEPQVRLHRMRAQEELIEVRDRDLAFSVQETHEFFTAFGVDLPVADVEIVHRRTEGWPTGIQMVAISMRAPTDHPMASAPRPDLQVHAVGGYFVEEVLARQPDAVVDFMLATSVLDELSVAACQALTGDGAAAMLDYLCASHLFVTMSDERASYRYHQLIKDVLQLELHGRDPQREAALHEAAARYLLETGHAAAAARHLLAAGQSESAFTLLSEQVVRDVLTNPTTSSALDIDEFRPEVFAGVPEVLVPLAAELLWRGAFDRGSRAVTLARECSIDASRQPELAVRMALVNTLFHTFVGEFDKALSYREAAGAIEPAATGVDDWVATLDALAMYCHTYVGHFREARALAERLAGPSASDALRELLCSGVMSQAALIEGHLDEAATLAARTLDAAERLHFDRHYFVFHALRTSGQLALERRDLVDATDVVERALSIVSSARPAFNFLAQVDRARIWAASGNEEAALASLPAARSALKSEHSILLAEADELEARLRLQLADHRGAVTTAARLPAARRVVMQTIIALATDDTTAAAQTLREARALPTTARLDVELQLLRANVALGQAQPDVAREIRRALDDAHRLGYQQTVLDTAPQLVDHVISHPELYDRTEKLAPLIRARLERSGRATKRGSDLAQPLTDAEIRVLTKLAERLSYAEIASELFVSLNTVKTHARNAYSKLGVNSRSSAITRASVLGLL